MPKLSSALLLAFLLSSSCLVAAAAPLDEQLRRRGYEQVANEGGVVVYQHRRSEPIRVFARGRIAHAPGAVRAALLDYDRHVGAIARLSESRILERGERTLLVYQRLDLPLVSDRDMTLLVRWGGGGEPGESWIEYEAVRDRGPAVKDGVVRLTSYKGRWVLRPAGDGATLALLHVTMSMGGSLPPAVASAGAGREFPDLFAAISGLASRAVAKR